MNDGHIDIPAAIVFLGFDFFVDFLRTGVTRAGADCPHSDAGMLLLEHRRQIVLDVIDHVLVASSDEIERAFLLRQRRHAEHKS